MTPYIISLFIKSVNELYQYIPEVEQVNIQRTRKEFKGDYTINVFPFLKISKQKPDETASNIGKKMMDLDSNIESFEVIKGFLNISLHNSFLIDQLKNLSSNEIKVAHPQNILIEYSSPNTNKPLHLGHVRNNVLGHSIAELLKSVGHKVTKVNLVNDRGIHICKSMLAWQKWGNGITPESAEIKGDKLVGNFYVKFSNELKNEVKTLVEKGIKEEEAEKTAQLMFEAREMLQQWEKGDSEVLKLWNTMNGWVYQGFDQTYKTLGISFDKIYYESQTYLNGKEIVLEGVNKKIFAIHPDGSVRIDLTSDGLDEKVLLRSDGTSVYITQDIGTAIIRQKEYDADQMIYVVGNEQNYHFQVLKLVLQKLGYAWAESIQHLSYGMVELPEGKMKSREGTVVDADDLIEGMIETARQTSAESGKLKDIGEKEAEMIHKMIALGALKYFILKVDPKKNMLFDPKESIDFEGNTGPFIQYTHARIRSILRKNETTINVDFQSSELSDIERDIIKSLTDFSNILFIAAEELNPGIIANYIFMLAKSYNQFYHECPILKEEDENKKLFRLFLSNETANMIKKGMGILGVEVPERM